MASTRSHNSVAIYLPADECAHAYGNNRIWDEALQVVDFHAREQRGSEEGHQINRCYTIRPARFPQDSDAVRSMLSEQIADVEPAPLKKVEGVLKAYAKETRDCVLLACQIIMDGGDREQSFSRRLRCAAQEVRHPNPAPLGLSYISTPGPDGYYVLFKDLPQSMLEEKVVGLVSMKPLKNADTTPQALRSTYRETRRRGLPGLWSRLQGRDRQYKGRAETVCELERLYVAPKHHKCLAYALVDTIIHHAKDNGFVTMTLTPTTAKGLGYAKTILEKAGPDPSDALAVTTVYIEHNGIAKKSPNPSAVNKIISRDDENNDVEVIELVLSEWPGPLDAGTAAKIIRRKRQQEQEAQEAQEGERQIVEAQQAERRSHSTIYFDNTTSPYEYYPLDESAQEVRLLTLLPGPPEDEIHISLEECEMFQGGRAKILKYEALSYTWGSTADPGYVFIGQRQQPLPVTRSLAEALIHLRYPDKPRHLWIDAICVNQADLQERGSQIARMADIYENAYRVIVWLGPGTAQSVEAMRILSFIGCTVEIDWFLHQITGLRDAHPESRNEEYLRDCANPNTRFPFNETQLECLLHLLSKSWFERLWIWQEIRMACDKSILQCGFDSMKWDDFSTSIFLMRHKGQCLDVDTDTAKNSQLVSAVELAYGICNYGVEDGKRLFDVTRRSKCSDQRDRVYALLSLLKDAKTELKVTPDYTKTVYEVYQEAALRFLLDLGKLEILASVELLEEDEYSANWSSWVPDWSKPRQTWPVSHAFAALISRPEISHSGRTISMAGIVVTEISGLCAFNSAAQPFKLSDIGPANDRYEAIRLNLVRILKYLSREQHLVWGDVMSFCRTIVAGEDADGFAPKTEGPSVTYRAMQDIMQRVLNVTLGGLEYAPSAGVHEHEGLILSHVLTHCQNRSLFRLQNGNFGFAPGTAREGDIVVVFLGCDNPLVLRPTGSQYRIVGEAYCDGVMNGEALLGPLPGGRLSIVPVDAETSFLYRNALKEGEMPFEDSRLGKLPPGWKRYEQDEQIYYRNKKANGGVGSKVDPRLTSSWLREHGVDVKTFEIV